MKIQSLNVLKFVMAIFVIITHTLCLTGMHNVVSDSKNITFIIRVAVPVFFIISGYLLFRKMNIRKKVDDARIWKYIKKILLLYFAFYLLYSVIAWYVASSAGIPFWEFLKYQVRKFLFVGESSYSWALWYLHGLILAVVLIWGMLKLFPKMKVWIFPIIAVVIWGIGSVAVVVGNERLGVIPGYSTFIFLFERVQRNGIFTGLPFMALGLWLSQIKRPKIWVGVGLAAIGLLFGIFGLDFGRIFLAIGIVIATLNINLEDRKIYNILGFSSKWIFLIHMAFIFIYIVLIKHKTDSTMGGEELGLFMFTLLTSLTTSLMIWYAGQQCYNERNEKKITQNKK